MFASLWISSLILPFFQNLMNASKCKVVVTNTESFTVIKSRIGRKFLHTVWYLDSRLTFHNTG